MWRRVFSVYMLHLQMSCHWSCHRSFHLLAMFNNPLLNLLHLFQWDSVQLYYSYWILAPAV